MNVGLDFDNTVVSYDELFYELARERELIPVETPRTKTAVRDHLRRAGQEPAWTALQALAYGPEIRRARMFSGVREFIDACRSQRVRVAIISHKTRQPYLGDASDLHASARAWLELHDLGLDGVFFEVTRELKLARIAALECTYFVDDLPEFLSLPEFPRQTRKVLFDPHGLHIPEPDVQRVASWPELSELLLCQSTLA